MLKNGTWMLYGTMAFHFLGTGCWNRGLGYAVGSGLV